MITETAVAVMVLAVHVGRHRPADTDHRSTGHDRQEPAPGHDLAEDFAERKAGGAAQDAGGGVEFTNLAQAETADNLTRERAVAITQPAAASDARASGIACKQGAQGVHIRRLMLPRRKPGIASPAVEHVGFPLHSSVVSCILWCIRASAARPR